MVSTLNLNSFITPDNYFYYRHVRNGGTSSSNINKTITFTIAPLTRPAYYDSDNVLHPQEDPRDKFPRPMGNVIVLVNAFSRNELYATAYGTQRIQNVISCAGSSLTVVSGSRIGRSAWNIAKAVSTFNMKMFSCADCFYYDQSKDPLQVKISYFNSDYQDKRKIITTIAIIPAEPSATFIKDLIVTAEVA